MKTFEVFSTTNNNYKAIIVSCSHDTVTQYFYDIEKYLNHENIKGTIILDYYHPPLRRSFSNRFYEIEFNGNNFINSSLKALSKTKKNSDYISSTYSKIPLSNFNKALVESLNLL